MDIYPTLARLCGLTPPAGLNGASLVPMLNNPDAPGKGWAYSRDINTLNQDSVRTDRWRLVRVNASYDLYDFQASPYEVNDVSVSFPEVVGDLATNKLNVQSVRAGTTTFNAWKSAHFSAEEQTNNAISGLHADADLDGIANVFELLGGTDPRNAADRMPLAGEVRDLSAYGLPADYFTARFTALSLVDDVAFSLEGSDELQSWSQSSLSFVTNSFLGSGFYEYVFRMTNDAVARPAGFIRLRAGQSQ